MGKRIWALVTGQIRSELYFRVLLIRLCDLRAKGVLDQIVYSTWDDEVEKHVGLREELRKLSIATVETPMPNADLEVKFNHLDYEFQRTTLFEGLRVIPQDCFVLKVRTDYNMGGLKRLLYLISQDEEKILEKLQVKTYGSFPIMYHQKIAMYVWGTSQLMFCNDRYFFGARNDLKKICLPLSNNKTRKNWIYAENALLNGYAYHFYPLLHESWQILSIEFYAALKNYCLGKTEEDLVLPRLIHRLYATICVYIYTHVCSLVAWDSKSDESPFSLIDLFRNTKYPTNFNVEKIIFGNLKRSNLSEIFKDELRKISLDLPTIHGYTYDEYEELRKFAVDELKAASTIGEYPFKSLKKDTVEKQQVASILLQKYQNEEFTKKIADLVNDNFDYFGRDIYHKIDIPNLDKETKYELLIAAIYDSDVIAMARYLEMVEQTGQLHKVSVLDHTIKYLYPPLCAGIDTASIVAVYYLLGIYKNHFKYENKVEKFRSRIRILLNKAGNHITKDWGRFFSNIKDDVGFLYFLVEQLNNKTTLETTELEIIKALFWINPQQCPISSRIIDLLKKKKEDSLISQISKHWPDISYVPGDWTISSKLNEGICQRDTRTLLEFARSVKGVRESDMLLKYFWDFKITHPEALQKEVSETMETLSQNYSEEPFILKLDQFLRTKVLKLNKTDIIYDENFIRLLEILYRMNLLKVNKKSVKEMRFNDNWRKLLYYVFFRLENDSRLEFFSMKGETEIWIHHYAYLNCNKFTEILIPQDREGVNWPQADRYNNSAFSSFLSLQGDNIHVSIEFCSTEKNIMKKIAENVGYDAKNSSDNVVRFHVESIPFQDELSLESAVNRAMDMICDVGDKIVERC